MSEAIVEILGDGEAEAVDVEETTSVEVLISAPATASSVPITEFIEVIEQGPQGPPGSGGGEGGVTDHGDLTGLADDDHTQYHNNTRGDVRYYTKAQVDTALSDKAEDADLTAHAADTTAVHGIADTSALVLTSDARLSDARTPTTHDHDDRYYTESEADTLLSGKAATSHNHTSSQVTDFVEAVQDVVAGLLASGSGVSVSYDDAGNTLTITATGGGGETDPEVVRDTIGVALAGVGLISVTVNDGADTITIGTTATANDTDANLKNRANHTGSQAISTITSLQTTLDEKALATDLTTHAADTTGIHGIADTSDIILEGDARLTDARTPTTHNHDTLYRSFTLRVTSATDTATLTVNAGTTDQANLTAQAQALTVDAPTGSPTDGQPLMFRFKDNGTARAISWNAAFRAVGVTLPTTTVATKTLYVGAKWNAADSVWDVLAVGQVA